MIPDHVDLPGARETRGPNFVSHAVDVLDAEGQMVGTVSFEITEARVLVVRWSGAPLQGFQAWSS